MSESLLHLGPEQQKLVIQEYTGLRAHVLAWRRERPETSTIPISISITTTITFIIRVLWFVL